MSLTLLSEPLGVPRLEYGKPGASGSQRRGGGGYQTLGASPDFPAELAPLARTWVVGPGRGQAGHQALERMGRCLAWRPVSTPTGSRWLACRAQHLPEPGTGRPSMRARFLAFPPDTGPWTILQTLSALELSTLSEEEAARGCGPLFISPAPLPEMDDACRAFLPWALERIVAGLPVSIVGLGPEGLASWAQHLSRFLPTSLAGRLSVAWGISASSARTWHLSVADASPVDTSVWHVGAGSGRDPRVSGSSPPRSGFRPERLVPGGMYLRVVLRWLADGPPALEEGPAWLPAELPPGREEQEVVVHRADLSEDRAAFVQAGWAALDRARLIALDDWLSAGTQEGRSTVSLDLTVLISEGSRGAAVTTVLEAFARPDDRLQAEEVLWATLRAAPTGPLADRILTHRGAGWERLALFAALQRAEDPVGILEALAEDSGPDALPQEAGVALLATLEAAIGDLDLAPHLSRLVAAAPLREPMASWVRSARPRLAVDWLRIDPRAALPALGSLGVGEPTVNLVRRWCAADPPEEADLLLLAAHPRALAEPVVAALCRHWIESDRQTREALLPWVRALRPLPPVDAVMALALGSGAELPLLANLVEAAELDALPESLVEEAALTLLRPGFGLVGAVTDGNGWRRVLERWPGWLQSLLCFREFVEGTSISPAVAAAAAVWRPAGAELDSLLIGWRDRSLPAEVARRLWSWCQEGGGPVAAQCEALASGRLSTTRLERPALRAAAHLAAAAAQAGVWEPDPERLFQQAHAGWQVMLILESLPDRDIEPPVDRVVLLLGERVWLAQHLTDPRTHPGRGRLLAVATCGFHTIVWPGQADLAWRWEWAGSALWAAYAGAPINAQGDLADGLRAWAPKGPAQAALLRVHLRSTRGDTALCSNARTRAHTQVLPALALHLHVNDLLAVLDAVAPPSWGSGLVERWLGCPLRPIEEPQGSLQIVERHGELCVSSWFVQLVKEVYRPIFRKAVRRSHRERLMARRHT